MESDILMWLNVTHHKRLSVYLLGQHARLVLVLSVISKLNLDLQSSELDSSLQRDGVGSIKDCLLGLFIKEIKLNGITENILLEFLGNICFKNNYRASTFASL